MDTPSARPQNTPQDSESEGNGSDSKRERVIAGSKIKSSPAEQKLIRAPSKSGKESDFFVEEASRIIRSEMERRGISYQDLLDALQDRAGEEAETRQALINKIVRGKFSFAFVLRLCEAMKISTLNVMPIESNANKSGRRP